MTRGGHPGSIIFVSFGVGVGIGREILFESPDGADDALAMAPVADRRRPRAASRVPITALREVHE